ncbi:TetR/AcrR family transcriptional regulator [soil metagenome]
MMKGIATRSRILDEAAKQASLRGLAVVSLNDVAESIGMSKSGLFKHFQAKEVMQHAVLEATIERFKETVWIPATLLPPGRARLDALFEGRLNWDEYECGEFGCLMHSAQVEFEDQPGSIRDLLHDAVRKLAEIMHDEFAALKTPPMSEDEIAQASFELNGLVTGFYQSRRVMADGEARLRARTAYIGLMQRLSA